MSIYFTLLQSQWNSLINPRSWRWSSNPIPFIKCLQCPLLFLIRFKVVSGLKGSGQESNLFEQCIPPATHIRCLDLIRRQVSKVRYSLDALGSSSQGPLPLQATWPNGPLPLVLPTLTHTVGIRYSEPGAVTHPWVCRAVVCCVSTATAWRWEQDALKLKGKR